MGSAFTPEQARGCCSAVAGGGDTCREPQVAWSGCCLPEPRGGRVHGTGHPQLVPALALTERRVPLFAGFTPLPQSPPHLRGLRLPPLAARGQRLTRECAAGGRSLPRGPWRAPRIQALPWSPQGCTRVSGRDGAEAQTHGACSTGPAFAFGNLHKRKGGKGRAGREVKLRRRDGCVSKVCGKFSSVL